ncbi:MAG: helix-turn-helix domain-containing protein [Alphaproteobacteria bacterium]|nr:helix-turn-helix domain-containing protein [Alphaproteobacteria bacterium]
MMKKSEFNRRKRTDRDKEIVSMRKEGYLLGEIAEYVNTSVATVSRVVSAHGVLSPDQEAVIERDKGIIELYQYGFSAEEIANNYGVSDGLVFCVLHNNNVPLRTPTISQETCDKILKLRLEGLSYGNIAKECGVSKASVSRIVNGVRGTRNHATKKIGNEALKKQRNNGILTMFALEKLSVTRIAREWNVSTSTVYNVIRNAEFYTNITKDETPYYLRLKSFINSGENLVKFAVEMGMYTNLERFIAVTIKDAVRYRIITQEKANVILGQYMARAV